LIDDQSMRLYNLNPAVGAFWINLHNRGEVYEFEYQVVLNFYGASGSIDLIVITISVVAQEISKGTLFYQPGIADTIFRGATPKSARQGEIPADRRCDPLRTSLDRYEPRSMGKRVLPRSVSFVRGLVAAAGRG
jgi:hypothetical protein